VPDENGNGEIAYFGRNVFMGYLNNEEKTKETFDNDNWLLSGDIGKIENEYLYVTGRIKELIITAGGKNISPVSIEENILSQQLLNFNVGPSSPVEMLKSRGKIRYLRTLDTLSIDFLLALLIAALIILSKA